MLRFFFFSAYEWILGLSWFFLLVGVFSALQVIVCGGDSMKEQRGYVLCGAVSEGDLLLAESGVTYGAFWKSCQNGFWSSITFYLGFLCKRFIFYWLASYRIFCSLLFLRMSVSSSWVCSVIFLDWMLKDWHIGFCLMSRLGKIGFVLCCKTAVCFTAFYT